MKRVYACDLKARLGPVSHDVESVRLLNRTVEWNHEGITIEGDQRHAEIIIEKLGLSSERSLSTPGDGINPKDMSEEDLGQLHSFAHESRGYENSLYLISELVLSRLKNNQKLNTQERKILILKVLQRNNWKTVIEKMKCDISGKKDALIMLRKAVAKLLQ